MKTWMKVLAVTVLAAAEATMLGQDCRRPDQ
jgi:hypothetical protein